MSRATVDLQAIRFFLGYGLIFITQNLLTIALVTVGDGRDQPAAGADRPRPGAADRLHRLALQPGLAPGAAGGPAADRRADRGSRGEHLRDPHRQGLRPRGAPAAPLPARRRPGLRPEHLLDPPAGLLLAADRPPAPARDRPGAAGRRPRGDQRQPQPRRLHRLLHLHGRSSPGRCGCSASRWGWRSGRSPPATASSRSSTASRGSRARPARPRCPPAAAESRCAASRSLRRAAGGERRGRPWPDGEVEVGPRRWRGSTSRSRPAAPSPWSALRARARPASSG